MPERTFFRRDGWEPDETEDYQKLKTDDERRRMLIADGFDEFHRAEAERLFPEQFQRYLEADKPSQEASHGDPCIDCKPCPGQSFNIKKFFGLLIGAITLLCAIVGAFADWDNALEKLRELFTALFP